MINYEGIESLGIKKDMQTFASSASPLFKDFIEEVKPKVIIEVGAWKGVSALIMAELSGGHVHTVDTFLGSAEHFILGQTIPRDQWGYPTLFHQFLTNVKDAGYSDKITPYPMTSADGAKYLAYLNVKAQLISIDGDHSFEGCYRDICDYWPLLEEGGMMMGDDFAVFPSVFAAALRFAVERGLSLTTQDPFWIIRKPAPLWPADYNISKTHCGDVLAGCYDVPMDNGEPVILDIGANVGAFARWAKKRWPHSVIHSYEPHPDNYALLGRTVEHYGLNNVMIYPVAISDTDGQKSFHHNGVNCGEWSLVPNSASHGEAMTVACVDAGNLPEADIVKLDTEGEEPTILLRMSQAGKLKNVSAVVLEYHASTAVGPITALLEHGGMKLFAHHKISEHRGILRFIR